MTGDCSRRRGSLICRVVGAGGLRRTAHTIAAASLHRCAPLPLPPSAGAAAPAG
uniref:Uncharacterized protein n=1 Tax=Arundo donax TaxID=35708 RepID=A0A0A9A1R8_ARUDO